METPIYVNKGFLALDLTEYESLKQQIEYLKKDKKHLEEQLLEGYDYIESFSYTESYGWYAGTKGYFSKDPEVIELKNKLKMLIKKNEEEKYKRYKLDCDAKESTMVIREVKSKWWYKLFKNL